WPQPGSSPSAPGCASGHALPTVRLQLFKAFERNTIMPNSLLPKDMDRRSVLKAGLFAGLGLAAVPSLAACGGASAGGGSAGGAVKWAGWDGPPSSDRFV